MFLTVIGFKLATTIITLVGNRAAGNIRINHSVTPLVPAAPSSPTTHYRGHSAEIVRNALRHNNTLEYRLLQEMTNINLEAFLHEDRAAQGQNSLEGYASLSSDLRASFSEL